MKEWQSKKILFIGFLLFCLHVYGKDVYGSDVLYVKAKVVKVNNAIVHSMDFYNKQYYKLIAILRTIG